MREIHFMTGRALKFVSTKPTRHMQKEGLLNKTPEGHYLFETSLLYRNEDQESHLMPVMQVSVYVSCVQGAIRIWSVRKCLKPSRFNAEVSSHKEHD